MKAFLLLCGMISTLLASEKEKPTLLEKINAELLGLHTQNPSIERDIKLAKLYFYSAKYSGSEEPLAQGLQLMEKTREQNPSDPGAILWWVALQGEAVQRGSKLKALGWIKKFEEALLTLRKLSPQYDHFGSDRALGHLYFKAPGFLSIGSSKKAREHFEMALRGDEKFPGNRLLYAEFLYDEGEIVRAKELVMPLLKENLEVEYPLEAPDWRLRVKALLASIETATIHR